MTSYVKLNSRTHWQARHNALYFATSKAASRMPMTGSMLPIPFSEGLPMLLDWTGSDLELS